MRNLGGAIGIAADRHVLTKPHRQAMPRPGGAASGRRSRGGAAGGPAHVRLFHSHAMGPVDAITKAMIAPMVQRAALTQSCNEAWLVLGVLFLTALLLVPAMVKPKGA